MRKTCRWTRSTINNVLIMKKLDIKNIITEDTTNFNPQHAISSLYVDPLKKIIQQPIALSAGYKFNEFVPLVNIR